MLNKYFIHLLLIGIFAFGCSKAENGQKCFFFDPVVISPNTIINELDSKTLNMCWQFGGNNFFHFITKKNEVYFEIIFENMPDFYDQPVKEMFIEKINCLQSEDKKYSIFSYEWKKDEPPIINQPRMFEKNRDPNTDAYLVDKRRIFEECKAQSISKNELLSIISGKNIIFYTGAGISVASNIPSMAQLYNLLGLKEAEEFVSSLQNALQDPGKFSQKIITFHDACFYSPLQRPTRHLQS